MLVRTPGPLAQIGDQLTALLGTTHPVIGLLEAEIREREDHEDGPAVNFLEELYAWGGRHRFNREAAVIQAIRDEAGDGMGLKAATNRFHTLVAGVARHDTAAYRRLAGYLGYEEAPEGDFPDARQPGESVPADAELVALLFPEAPCPCPDCRTRSDGLTPCACEDCQVERDHHPCACDPCRRAAAANR